MNNARSMLGGSLDPKAKKEEMIMPGPGHYNNLPIQEPPGFRIEVPKGKSLKVIDKTKEPVGLQKYTPYNPNHDKSDHLIKQSFGH